VSVMSVRVVPYLSLRPGWAQVLRTAGGALGPLQAGTHFDVRRDQSSGSGSQSAEADRTALLLTEIDVGDLGGGNEDSTTLLVGKGQ